MPTQPDNQPDNWLYLYSVKRDKEGRWILTVNDVPLLSYASENEATEAAVQFATSRANQGGSSKIQIFGSGGQKPSFETVLEAKARS